MEQLDILLAIAQIGVAIAGFASLATVIGHTKKRTDPKVSSIRLRGLLETSLSGTLLALIAVVLVSLELTDGNTWRLASLIGVGAVTFIGGGVIRRGWSVRHLPGYNSQVAKILYVIFALVSVGFLINVFGAPEQLAFPIYAACLLLILVICGVWFILVVVSLLRGVVGDD